MTKGFVEMFEIWSMIALKLLDESIYFLASISCIVLDFQNVLNNHYSKWYFLIYINGMKTDLLVAVFRRKLS